MSSGYFSGSKSRIFRDRLLSVADERIHVLTAQPVSWNHIHWRTSPLCEIPPVHIVTECNPLEFRKELARYIDGRLAQAALTEVVEAIRREYLLEPFPYVVSFPDDGFEIPVDLRPIAEEESELAAIVTLPRSMSEAPFDLAQLNARLAEQLHTSRREEAIEALKQLSRDTSEVVVSDIGDRDDRFIHFFIEGVYRHSYRYLAAKLDPDSRTPSAENGG
jgi:hypothetical protein